MYTCEGGWPLVQPETGGRNDVFAIGSQHQEELRSLHLCLFVSRGLAGNQYLAGARACINTLGGLK